MTNHKAQAPSTRRAALPSGTEAPAAPVAPPKSILVGIGSTIPGSAPDMTPVGFTPELPVRVPVPVHWIETLSPNRPDRWLDSHAQPHKSSVAVVVVMVEDGFSKSVKNLGGSPDTVSKFSRVGGRFMDDGRHVTLSRGIVGF
jgi:hypothetical protein